MNRKGFTLIELMIVIAIIGILAAIAIPNFQKARGQAREKSCYSNIRVILGAVEMYNMDTVPMMCTLNVPTLVTGNYLKAAPKCPETNLETDYTGTNLTTNGKIECKGHGDIDSKKGPLNP